NRYRIDVDAAGDLWADFDQLGFNKDWVVVTANVFHRNDGPLDGVWVWVFDKADLYTNGAGTATLLKFVDNDPDFIAFAVAPTHAVAQWWQFLPSGTLEQFGRVEDPNGGRSYAYPSLAVNASNDVLVGYSRFSGSQYASANYSFRFATDPLNSLRADTLLHAGDGVYIRFDGTLNRWGDYSASCVDPLDDQAFWTIQEYGSNNRWNTQWARVEPDRSAVTLRLAQPADGISYPAGATVALTA